MDHQIVNYTTNQCQNCSIGFWPDELRSCKRSSPFLVFLDFLWIFFSLFTTATRDAVMVVVRLDPGADPCHGGDDHHHVDNDRLHETQQYTGGEKYH